MNYSTKITTDAKIQIQTIIEYISKVLLAPFSARKWSNKLQKKMTQLGNFPLMYPLIDKEPWKSRGIHRMTVGNFNVFYFVKEKEKEVWIISVLYSRRDMLPTLKNAI